MKKVITIKLKKERAFGFQDKGASVGSSKAPKSRDYSMDLNELLKEVKEKIKECAKQDKLKDWELSTLRRLGKKARTILAIFHLKGENITLKIILYHQKILEEALFNFLEEEYSFQYTVSIVISSKQITMKFYFKEIEKYPWSWTEIKEIFGLDREHMDTYLTRLSHAPEVQNDFSHYRLEKKDMAFIHPWTDPRVEQPFSPTLLSETPTHYVNKEVYLPTLIQWKHLHQEKGFREIFIDSHAALSSYMLHVYKKRWNGKGWELIPSERIRIFGRGFNIQYIQMLQKYPLKTHGAVFYHDEVTWFTYYSAPFFGYHHLCQGTLLENIRLKSPVFIPTKNQLLRLIEKTNQFSEVEYKKARSKMAFAFQEWKKDFQEDNEYKSPIALLLRFFMSLYKKEWDDNQKRWIDERTSLDINEYLTVKLRESGGTVIYVANKEFMQCKYLLINIVEDYDAVKEYDDKPTIDDISEYYNHTHETRKGAVNITPEEEFWGHCSNLQVWVESGYNCDLLHSSLAFPLLKRLMEAGDPKARRAYKEEIAVRLSQGHLNILEVFLQGAYLDPFNETELETISRDIKDPLQRFLVLNVNRMKSHALNYTFDDKQKSITIGEKIKPSSSGTFFTPRVQLYPSLYCREKLMFTHNDNKMRIYEEKVEKGAFLFFPKIDIAFRRATWDVIKLLFPQIEKALIYHVSNKLHFIIGDYVLNVPSISGFGAQVEIELEKRKRALSKKIQGIQERAGRQQEELRQNTLKRWIS